MIPLPLIAAATAIKAHWRIAALLTVAAAAWWWHASAVRHARAAGLAEGRAEVQAVLDAERAASAAAARQYEAAHRAQMDAAAATARQREAALKTQMTGVRRALWTATENLASCRLDRDAVRLLRDAARGPAANQPATARTD